MTEQQKTNNRIARFVGLERIAPFRRYNRRGQEDPNGVVWMYCEEDMGGAKTFALIPNYCIDLNAMHNAEGVLTIPQVSIYMFELSLNMRHPKRTGKVTEFLFHATAAQKAEAMVRTIERIERGQVNE